MEVGEPLSLHHPLVETQQVESLVEAECSYADSASGMMEGGLSVGVLGVGRPGTPVKYYPLQQAVEGTLVRSVGSQADLQEVVGLKRGVVEGYSEVEEGILGAWIV